MAVLRNWQNYCPLVPWTAWCTTALDHSALGNSASSCPRHRGAVFWLFLKQAWNNCIIPKHQDHSWQSGEVVYLKYTQKHSPHYIWATSRQNQQNDCAPSEDSDQPGHPPSLIRVFAVHSMGSYGTKLSSCGQRRLWSDWADAQADLSLRLAHKPFCWFCHEAAQLWGIAGTQCLALWGQAES